MNDDSLDRLMILAAAAGLSSQEARQALRAAQEMGLDELTERYRMIRARVKKLEKGNIFPAESYVQDVGTRVSVVLKRDIIRMMREANLPPAQAVARIKEQLKKDNKDESTPAYNQKEGVGRWIERAASAVGHSALLNASTQSLGSVSQKGPRDWKLSD